jgi:hypothetical protein
MSGIEIELRKFKYWEVVEDVIDLSVMVYVVY